MKAVTPISLDGARALLDFRGGAGAPHGIPDLVAEAQLTGAVALHNILAREGFAYLADEVGMGKTYVALGAVALMRFNNPALRVAYIAPRENIQEKWTKELRNFSRTNWRSRDQRVRSVQDLPARDYVRCASLADWARQAVLRPDRDTFLRMHSFSFSLGENWSTKREELRRLAPFIELSGMDLRNKKAFKEAYALAINALLPTYDLLVVDEAHNLKGGRESSTDRNRLIELVLGSAPDGSGKHFGKRFERVLFLSATPLESDFAQLWNQLDLFGIRQGGLDVLKDPDVPDEMKRDLARRFLVRRLTGLQINGSLHTKNMYRREWRAGGCAVHDEALAVPDPKQRLIVALVQKKVAEVLHDPRFGNQFQMGMLASFESFVQTAMRKLAPGSEDEPQSNFDQTDQTDDAIAREGLDTPAINQIAESYRRKFGSSMPHPKMDVVVNSLATLFDSGDKALVFVRRIRSVTEMREKLCDRYDAWFRCFLESRLDAPLHAELGRAWTMYEDERKARRRAFDVETAPGAVEIADEEEVALKARDVDDEGGHETFFSWFFRGQGPEGFLSGAAVRKNRFQSEGSVYSTFFEENHVARLLGWPEGSIVAALARATGRTAEETEAELRDLAFGLCKRRGQDRSPPRFIVFEAYQGAALTLLARPGSMVESEGSVVLRLRFPGASKAHPRRAPRGFPEADAALGTRTFFTELRRRPQLANRIWPEPTGADFEGTFRAREQRRELLAAVARLGHTFVELWSLAVNQLGSLQRTRQESSEEGVEQLIEAFLALLEREQATTDAGVRGFHAYHELSAVGQHHDLILAVNFPDVATKALGLLPRLLATTLGRQTPVAGMHGGVSKTVVAQFRMPGYPLALVTTDVLQEGEDLHTFCSQVIHYGISWTPSAMEQRTGRVDRIGSRTHRDLDDTPHAPDPRKLLQVHYPYLADTVEVLQVERVFERMNRFLRTIHHTGGEQSGDSRIDANAEFVRPRKDIHQIKTPLKSAFDVVADRDLTGDAVDALSPARALREIVTHFRFVTSQVAEELRIDWDAAQEGGMERFGTAYVEGERVLLAEDASAPDAPGVRNQPFALYLRAGAGGHTLLHATSPVGDVARDAVSALRLLEIQAQLQGAKVCRLPRGSGGSYTVTVESDILLTPQVTQIEEVVDLLRRVLAAADLVERYLFREDQEYEQFADSLRKEASRAAD